MKVLHVMKTLPYPPVDGFRSDIWTRLLALRGLGYRIHLLTTAAEPDAGDANLAVIRSVVERITFVRRVPIAVCALKLRPMQVARSGRLAKVPLDERYDLVLAESEEVLPIFENPTLSAKVRALRVHNNESKYMAELSAADYRIFWKLFFASEALKYGLLAKRSHRLVDQLWFISREEADQCAAGKVVARWLPPGLEPLPASLPVRDRDSRRVLFVGSLSVPLNCEAVRWYVRNVHPLLLDVPGYEFVVAGSSGGSGNAMQLATELASAAACQVCVDPVSLDPLYRSAGVFVNPMRRGSGVKMKTIHAIREGIPVVTTRVGAEGSGFEDRVHLRIEDTAEDFAAGIRELILDPAGSQKMASCGFEYLRTVYDCGGNLSALLEAL